MYKKLSFLFCLAIMIYYSDFSLISMAANSNITILDDGYYLVTEVHDSISDVAVCSTTKNGSKTSKLYDENGQLLASFTVYGTFLIENGIHVECTSVSYSQNVSGNNLRFLSATISRNNTSTDSASVVGTGMYKNKNTGKQVNLSVTLSCSKTGVLS